MNFEPPDSLHDTARGSREDSTLFTRRRFNKNIGNDNSSPLVRHIEPQSNTKFTNKRFNSRGKFNSKFQNRLGGRNDYQNSNTKQEHKNSIDMLPNRKRTIDSNHGPPNKSLRFNNNRNFHYDSNSSLNRGSTHQSAQERITKIRNSGNFVGEDEDFSISTKNTSYSEAKFEAKEEPTEFDASDITVEVVNSICENTESISKFKMVLDPKVQASIKILQEKRKEKQVVFPFPVKPNVTSISTHERFSYL